MLFWNRKPSSLNNYWEFWHIQKGNPLHLIMIQLIGSGSFSYSSIGATLASLSYALCFLIKRQKYRPEYRKCKIYCTSQGISARCIINAFCERCKLKNLKFHKEMYVLVSVFATQKLILWFMKASVSSNIALKKPNIWPITKLHKLFEYLESIRI